jgi:hypothetical protein
VNIEERGHSGRISPGNDHHSRPAIAHDLLQDESRSGIWKGPVALSLERRKSSVIIKHKQRLGRARDSP